ncbi:MAG: hypothetical protein JWO60_2044 [Frankiales bacterium]|nr:hypothetical protein [Frankiales bacterium]
MSADTGVQLVADDQGVRSTTPVTRAVVAEAVGAVDAAAGARAGAEKDWRTGYLRHVVAMTAAGARSPDACLTVARTGLDAVNARTVFVRDGAERPVGEVLAGASAPVLGTEVLQGTGERSRELAVPYRGEVLRGDALRRQLDAWVGAGTVEPSFRTAVDRVLAHPEWLDLTDRAVLVLGAGAEMGPLEALVGWGAHVLAVDVPSERVWERVRRTALAGAGTVSVPTLDGVAGADLLQQTMELLVWAEATAPGLPLTVGSYTYADGGTHLRLAHAADALVVELLRRRDDVSYAELATPTDAFVVPAEVVQEARRRYAARGVLGLAQAPARRAGFYVPSYTADVPTDDGRTVGVTDSLVPQQGPNYMLAKRLQRWRALVGRADGVLVSANVAPATRTRSVTKNKVLAAAYAGAHRFGVEVFEPATSRALMAALLVHDLREPSAAGNPAAPQQHPEDLLAESAAHGGFWRSGYEPRSVLTLAAAAGLPGLLLRR